MCSKHVKLLTPLVIQDELGVISLRQEARMLARHSGLELSAQAKITAAVSGVVRGLLDRGAVVLVKMAITADHTLEIRCGSCATGKQMNDQQLRQLLEQAHTATLIDRLDIVHEDGHPFVHLAVQCENKWW